jgi:signal transduction histidine kinase
MPRRYGRRASPPSTARPIALSLQDDDGARARGYRRPISRRRADLLLAVALAVPSVAQVLVWPIFDPPVVGVAIALASTLPIALRRTHPALAAFLGVLPWFVPTDGYVVLGYVAAFVLFYSLAAYGRHVVLVAAFGVAVAVLNSWLNHEVPGEYAGAVTAVVLPALAGRLVRHQRAQTERLRKLSAELERERELTAQLAVIEERARIARELHDVVAHSLSVIAIQADGAEAALEKDAQLAQRPLRAIRRSAEDALAEMRRLLGVLRAEDEGAELAPQPGLAQLPALVERARAAGMPVTLLVDGEPRPLPASLDLSAYRIIQEALTNVHKHAGNSPASVRVVWRRNLLGLQVRDTGSGRPIHVNGDGHGLVGMRERVKLHGGELRAGALPGGGFEVTARLPL